ncbi:MAG: lasso peptide biosynthesis B2 protein [Sphingobium sp.]|nr:lasso peptide biosynthesis B2 protein [Sphingobium sp.]
MGFRLRDDLHYCVAGQRAIFLDVVADRYFTLPRFADIAFQRVARGAPIGGDDESALAWLTRQGLLLPDAGAAVPWPGAPLPRALHDSFAAAGTAVPLQVLASAVLMQIRAEWMLRRWPFADVISRLRALKPAGSGPAGAAEGARVAAIARAFRQTRFLFRPGNRCLARALGFALCAYRARVSPSLVFGVRTNPFVAHCWLQSGDRIVHDDSGQAMLFTPIMVV